MSKQKFLYKTIGPQNEVKYHKNTVELQQFFNRAKPVIRSAMKNNVYLDGYKIYELDEPFEFKKPVADQKITIECVQCTVIAVYDKTFSVVTDLGNRLVKLSSMKFVETVVNGTDRVYPLTTRNY